LTRRASFLNEARKENEPMITITVDVKKSDPSLKELLAQVAAGKEVIFTQGNQLVARLVPAGKRIPGLHDGAAQIAPDFDAPLPDNFWTGERK
jgi:antitoxin (DNA-binding transcriptional repressor) of toxin-antitoxin stability system